MQDLPDVAEDLVIVGFRGRAADGGSRGSHNGRGGDGGVEWRGTPPSPPPSSAFNVRPRVTVATTGDRPERPGGRSDWAARNVVRCMRMPLDDQSTCSSSTTK